MLNGVGAQTARTYDDSRAAWWDPRKGPLHCVVGGRACVCQWSGDNGIKGVELHKFTRRGDQYVTSKATIDPVSATND